MSFFYSKGILGETNEKCLWPKQTTTRLKWELSLSSFRTHGAVKEQALSSKTFPWKIICVDRYCVDFPVFCCAPDRARHNRPHTITVSCELCFSQSDVSLITFLCERENDSRKNSQGSDGTFCSNLFIVFNHSDSALYTKVEKSDLRICIFHPLSTLRKTLLQTEKNSHVSKTTL